ncbi:hypothetical protein BDV12DRAFT_164986 [Aspergillus spectabilis]
MIFTDISLPVQLPSSRVIIHTRTSLSPPVPRSGPTRGDYSSPPSLKPLTNAAQLPSSTAVPSPSSYSPPTRLSLTLLIAQSLFFLSSLFCFVQL